MDDIEETSASQQVVKYSITDQDLTDLAQRCEGISAHDDYPLAKVRAKECQKLRKVLEEARKELKQDALRFGQRVDGEAKRIREHIESIEFPILNSIKVIDDAEKVKEQERVNEIQDRIETIRNEGLLLDGLSMEDLEKRQNFITAQLLTQSDKEPFEEFLLDAEGAKAETETRLRLAVHRLGLRLLEEKKLEDQRQEQAEQQERLDVQQAEIAAAKTKLLEEEHERNRKAVEEADAKNQLDREADRIRREDLDREQVALKEMRDRLEADEAREKAAEEKAATEKLALEQAPDVDKLLHFAGELDATLGKFPLLDTVAGNDIKQWAARDIVQIIAHIKTQAGEMQ